MSDLNYLLIAIIVNLIGSALAIFLQLKKARKQRDKSVRLSAELLARIEAFLKYERKFERDKQTMYKAVKNTNMPYDEGFNESELVKTITDSHQLIMESHFKFHTAKEELKHYFNSIKEEIKGKEETK